MKCLTTGVMVIVMIALAFGCGAKAGPNHGTRDSASGPYPVEFRDIVQGYLLNSFDRGEILRNSVVRPPGAAWVEHEGEQLAGYVGEVDFSLKNEARQSFDRVTYCYFLFQGTVLLFEDRATAAWCKTTNNQGD